MDRAIERFAIFGAVEGEISLNLSEDIDTIMRGQFCKNYHKFRELIEPSYLLEEPYSRLLRGVSRGDGRLSNIFRRARVGDSLGRDILEEFSSLDIITFEPSREAPLRKYPAQRLKRHLRSYVIEPKVRFNTPFLNFWFALVFPFESELERRGFLIGLLGRKAFQLGRIIITIIWKPGFYWFGNQAYSKLEGFS